MFTAPCGSPTASAAAPRRSDATLLRDISADWQKQEDTSAASNSLLDTAVWLSFLQECVQARNASAGAAASAAAEGDENDTSSISSRLFVKVSPEMTEQELRAVAEICQNVGMDGIIVAPVANPHRLRGGLRRRPTDVVAGRRSIGHDDQDGEPVSADIIDLRRAFPAGRA